MPVLVSFLRSRPVLLRSWGVLLVVTVAVLLVQSLTKVWTSDIGADPDEPAHAVTALMVRDYLASGFSQGPMTFAKTYYEDFPKVALGHYPPGYYALGALLLLPWPQVQTLLVLQAVLTGCLAMQTYLLGRRFLREGTAVAAAALVAGFPVTLKLTQLAMADLLLACLCLLAVEWWARFLERPRATMALLFGFTAAAAILTKGSALALALVPPVTLLALGRWELLKKPAFWLAGVPVGVLAGPWMLYSSKITQEGMVKESLLSFATGAVKYYGSSLSISFGFATVMVAAAGLLMWLGYTKIKVKPDMRRASLLGLLVGTLLIMLLIPTGYSNRYFLPLVPVVALLAVSFCQATLARTQILPAMLAALVMLVWLQVPGLLVKNVSGYHTAVTEALKENPIRVENGTDKSPTPAQEHWLVSADPRGEGAVIAHAAYDLPQRSPSSLRIHRGSKELASTDWLGRDYKPAFATPAELQKYLDTTGIRRVFVDRSETATGKIPHEELLLQTLKENTAIWKLAHTYEITRPYMQAPGSLEVWVRAQVP
ncbi:MAG TPA: glycosyltransferase family 39 protein [Prosthecobacter sp.]